VLTERTEHLDAIRSALWRGAYRAPVQRSSIPLRARVRAGKPVPDAFLLPCLSQHSPDAVWRICSGLPENPDSVRTIYRQQPFGFHCRSLPATLVALCSTIDGA
jgi:hypothetical protein